MHVCTYSVKFRLYYIVINKLFEERELERKEYSRRLCSTSLLQNLRTELQVAQGARGVIVLLASPQFTN